MVKSLGQVLVFEVHATAVTGRTPFPRSIKDIWGHKQHDSKQERKRTHMGRFLFAFIKIDIN